MMTRDEINAIYLTARRLERQRTQVSITPAIAKELYRALERLDADPELLCIVGSWGDTLDDGEVLELLKAWNESGKILHTSQ